MTRVAQSTVVMRSGSWAGPTAGHRTARPVRLTRRGRIAVVLLALLAAFAVLALRSAPAASTDVVHHPALRTVIVTPGQTLWDIARRAEPTADPREVVAQIEEINGLSDGGLLRVGQPLRVPAD